MSLGVYALFSLTINSSFFKTGGGKKRLAIDNVDAFLACACPGTSGDAAISSNGSSSSSSGSNRLYGSSASTDGYQRIVIFVDNAGGVDLQG